MGFIGDHGGARMALALGGLAALIAAGIGLYTAKQLQKRELVDESVAD